MASYSTKRFSGRSSRTSSSNSRSFSRSSSPQRRGPKKAYIHPSKFVQAARPVELEVYIPKHTFSDFAMHPALHANLAAKGYVTPSPIQDQTIPLGLQKHDVIGIANTGTGKTAAFAIPVLHHLLNVKGSRALIVAPTRELAEQIQAECKSLAKGSGLFGTLLIGGSSMGTQLRDLKQNPEIVIGTPGRIKDHLERGTLKFDRFEMVVLDEVDRMLDMGFINDVRDILSRIPEKRQSFFFSATMEQNVKTLINTFAHDPVMVSVKTGETSENVEQNVVHYVASTDKIDKLHDILLTQGVKAIVFDETQRSVERLSKELIARGFDADAIHGGKTQGQRQRALRRFKQNEVNVLVATDVAARGIDVVDITHVINYTTPQSYEDYVHRIGRTGRAGRTGQALTFITR